MTCAKVRKLLPLHAGGDLPPRRAARLQTHLDGCADCRRELESFRMARAQVRAAAAEEPVPGWSEAEWNALMVRATAGRIERRGSALAVRPRWALAAGAVGVALIAVAILVTGVFRGVPSPAHELVAASTQDVVSVTLVSPDTGLQVVWVFNKNFDLKGEFE
jgi:predicted anti-sigma-YlaC factor YlaD